MHITPELLDQIINEATQPSGVYSMDWYTAGQLLWECLSTKYPELTGGALQVVGGATVAYRLLGSSKLAGSGSSVIGWLGKLALNK